MIIEEFLGRIQKIYEGGNATEHSYRSAIETLFHKLDSEIVALNEPKRVSAGAPDFIISRGDVPIGHVEAKDVPVDIRKLKDANKNQQERYLKAFPNLLYTNGLDFDFYRDGERIHSVKIADFFMGIQPKPENFDQLEHLLRDFLTQTPQTITSTRNLALRMAGKALVIKDVLFNLLREDREFRTELGAQYLAFKDQLIHDISVEDFADIYAETLAYGMFAARLHDDTTKDFSRYEALDRLPKTYPFLRSLFTFIAGQDLDDRIRWVIDELARVFLACDLHALMADFGRMTGRNDPFLHFYEDFLKEYNPAKRKSRGVWYTPEPVVNFIVRAVDDVLQKEFGLPMGLADTSKVTIDWDTGQKDKNGKPIMTKKDVHRVQILDPATGTGTFLAEVIKQIAPKIKGMAEGMWSGYVERDLIPRLHGFELLMASYAMCHMKLDMVLTELGYKPSANPPRMSVYLTNSLEEGEPADQTLPFAQWLSREVKEANTIKRDMPIMCIIGNPPYSGISQNMGPWISNLIEDYKYVDGEHFGERKHWLHDDYVKFIRFAEHMIEKNGEGVLGFITNHGYLDNPTFRGMRWHLMRTFDKIYILDLHGNAKKEEIAPDGSNDQNVFDIQQGVAILVGVKKRGNLSTSAVVQHGEFWGSRNQKYKALFSGSRSQSISSDLQYSSPQYSFTPRNTEFEKQYSEGFPISKLMRENITGIVTMGDSFAIAQSSSALEERFRDFLEIDYTEPHLKNRYSLGKNYAKWILENKISLSQSQPQLVEIDYRPFDKRWSYFDNRIMWRWREKIMRHMLKQENLALAFCRQSAVESWSNAFVADSIGDDSYVSNRTKERAYFAPFYLYPEETDLDQTRRINFDDKIVTKFAEGLRLTYTPTPADQPVPLDASLRAERSNPDSFDELDLFNYIYAVLHCPAYRETYREFLKTDFPRIPYLTDPDLLWDLVGKGDQLRRLHLMEPAIIGDTPFPFKGDGNNEVGKPTRADDGKVFINKDQYFDNVSETAWNFHIGGYQPAQKWLKDRKGRQLTFDDVQHYQRIIKILDETDRIMKTIDMPLDI